MQMCANIGPTIALADAANIDLSGIAVDPDTWAQCATRAHELASGDQQHLDSPLLGSALPAPDRSLTSAYRSR